MRSTIFSPKVYLGTCLLFLVFLGSCRDGKRYHSEAEVTATTRADENKVAVVGLKAILAHQEELNAEFSDPETSPLSQEELRKFDGLPFFSPDTTYQVWARLERSPQALPFDMPTTTERMARERRYGVLKFNLNGESFQLEVYQSPDLMLQEGMEDYLFLPFTDRTNGETTYEGGRYMDLRIPSGDSLLLDFNRAYNPYCAYNVKYSCPIVPQVNHLDTEVQAGVRYY
ncbi:DUF1684 domain-containing protein [Robiginitalea myxolifaciens]|nr:DUF1684 domain-containing protein [Robiginitalea myxolifaciens]